MHEFHTPPYTLIHTLKRKRKVLPWNEPKKEQHGSHCSEIFITTTANIQVAEFPRVQDISCGCRRVILTVFFLKFDPESLVACSNAHPSFSPIAEKHLYHRVTIQTSTSHQIDFRNYGYQFNPSQLLELLSESPQIADHVRVLQLKFFDHYSKQAEYHQIAQILPLFPLVKCIILRSSYSISWKTGLPQTLRMAVENCLRLSTMQEIHIGAALIFPLSLLNKHADITCLSFSAYPQMPDRPDDTYPPLQLKSLIFECLHDKYYDSISTWTKPHITTLRSLQCIYSNEILELLDVCSGTLNNLDLQVRAPYVTNYYIAPGRVLDTNTPLKPLINLSSLRYLQHLTIRVHTYHSYEFFDEICVSCLPTAAKILKTASSSLQHLTIEIIVDNHVQHRIDYSPLTMLAEASAPFHHIDLYTRVPFVEIYPKLACYEGLEKLIKQGILVINAEQTAPGISQFE